MLALVGLGFSEKVSKSLKKLDVVLLNEGLLRTCGDAWWDKALITIHSPLIISTPKISTFPKMSTFPKISTLNLKTIVSNKGPI